MTMSGDNTGRKQKTALVIVNNEIVSDAIEGVLEEKGYAVSRDVESSARADVGFVGGYFLLLGILLYLRSLNPSLPLVLIVEADYHLN